MLMPPFCSVAGLSIQAALRPAVNRYAVASSTGMIRTLLYEAAALDLGEDDICQCGMRRWRNPARSPDDYLVLLRGLPDGPYGPQLWTVRFQAEYGLRAAA